VDGGAVTAPPVTAGARAASLEPGPPSAGDVRRGLLLGFIGVAIFAMTFPMTRLAVGDAAHPQLSPEFVTAARAALAGLLSVLYLRLVGAARPAREHLKPLAICALGTVVGFPLCIAVALREVESTHAAVVSGVIPLGTAIVGALSLGQRPSRGFWLCALGGCALVLAFALQAGGGRLVAADGWLLLAVLSTAFGYVGGARVAAVLPAQQVICWVVAGSLPLTLPLALWWWPTGPVSGPAWGGLLYVSLFSMWLGFFAWYRGLALGGLVRVSQVQLLQPFLALLFAVPVLGEPLEPVTVGFALAVLAVVFIGRRMPVGQPRAR
jgi:drug/metabolite transporter (DMT)-like permease